MHKHSAAGVNAVRGAVVAQILFGAKRDTVNHRCFIATDEAPVIAEWDVRLQSD